MFGYDGLFPWRVGTSGRSGTKAADPVAIHRSPQSVVNYGTRPQPRRADDGRVGGAPPMKTGRSRCERKRQASVWFSAHSLMTSAIMIGGFDSRTGAPSAAQTEDAHELRHAARDTGNMHVADDVARRAVKKAELLLEISLADRRAGRID
jgi:hypothetical protein